MAHRFFKDFQAISTYLKAKMLPKNQLNNNTQNVNVLYIQLFNH
jgi:hypothetical protein